MIHKILLPNIFFRDRLFHKKKLEHRHIVTTIGGRYVGILSEDKRRRTAVINPRLERNKHSTSTEYREGSLNYL